jgi:hypothetical protein
MKLYDQKYFNIELVFYGLIAEVNVYFLLIFLMAENYKVGFFRGKSEAGSF